MTALSPKALRIIESGLNLMPDRNARTAWTQWIGTHPTPQSCEEPLPPSVLSAALAALEVKVQDLMRLRKAAPDDETFYFDNDISYVKAIESTLIRTSRLGT
jgi:hypothetical protein